MTKRDDGGPAFPAKWDDHHDHLGNPDGTSGMTLRDWFAGQALAGLAANKKQTEAALGLGPEDARVLLAKTSYAIADAMLAARK